MGEGQGDTTSERLIFAKTCIDEPQSFKDNVLWTDEIKAELFEDAVLQCVYW